MCCACFLCLPTTASFDWADSAVVALPAPPMAWMAAVMRSGCANGPRLARYGSASVPEPPVMVSTTGSPSLMAVELETSYSCGRGQHCMQIRPVLGVASSYDGRLAKQGASGRSSLHTCAL